METSNDGIVKPTGTPHRCPSEGEVPLASPPVRPSVTQSILNKTRGEDSGIAAPSVNQAGVNDCSSSSSQVSWGYQVEEYAAQFSTKESTSLDSQKNELSEGGLGDRNVTGLHQQEEGEEIVEVLSAEEVKLSQYVPTTKGEKQHEIGENDSEEQSTNSELPSKQSIPPPTLRRYEASPTQPGAVAVPGPDALEGGINNNEQRPQRSVLNQEDSSIQHPAAVRPGEQLVDAVLVDSQRRSSSLPFVHAMMVPLKRPWWRRRRACGVGIILFLVGLTIGLVVPLTTINNNNDNEDTPTPSPTALTTITIMLELDDNPEETGWMLECQDQLVVDRPEGTYAGRANDLIITLVQLVLGDDCVFIITDAGRNGLVGGSFEIFLGENTTDTDNLLVSGSGEFIGQQRKPFRVLPPPDPSRLVIITVVIQLDGSPQETGWGLECTEGVVFDFPVGTVQRQPFERLVGVEQVVLFDNCTFHIEDSGRNGIDDGIYEVYFGDNITNPNDRLVAGTGDFVEIVVKPFTVEDPGRT